MTNISINKIEEAVYNLCVTANTNYPDDLYNIVYDKFVHCSNITEKYKLANILLNAKLANEKRRPLCQDTGQVLVFIELGQDCQIVDGSLKTAINNAVRRAYTDNYYRKSVVHNAIFNRENTLDNTPAIIYTDIVDGETIKIDLLVKGAGSENYSTLKTFSPSANNTELFEYISQVIEAAGEKSCPPYVIGIGAGGTIESAALLSKKSFFTVDNSQEELTFIKELKAYLNKSFDNILDVKFLSTATHIASLPLAVTISCHSTRHASCILSSDNIVYTKNIAEFKEISCDSLNIPEIMTSDLEKMRSLKAGDKFLLTGDIYTARDAAHKKMYNEFVSKGLLPCDLKNKIVFYAGPCPATPSEIIVPVGPTTSARMDAYTDFMLKQGVFAFIGKGEREENAVSSIVNNNAKYFTLQGGIACLLANCVKNNDVIAYEELGTEAIRKLYVEKLPLTVNI